MLKYHPMTERKKWIVCDWKYEGAYAIYNLPPYEEQLRAQRGFANPVNSFHSFCDGEESIGYINLIEEGKRGILRNRRAVACYEKAGFCTVGEAFSQETSAGKGGFIAWLRKVKRTPFCPNGVLFLYICV